MRFLAVAMATSSAQAAQEVQPTQPTEHHPASPGSEMCADPAGLNSTEESDTAQAGQGAEQLTESALAGLALVTAEVSSPELQQPRHWSSQTGLAGPLFLQSDFAARHYNQDIWDFGVEQLLLQGTFWEQLPQLQVPACLFCSSNACTPFCRFYCCVSCPSKLPAAYNQWILPSHATDSTECLAYLYIRT